MIVFDLDGTLACCEHRRYFVDPEKDADYVRHVHYADGDLHHTYYHKIINKKWKPDWRSFYESCSEDKLILPTAKIFFLLWDSYLQPIEIWSGRCESVKKKTENWLSDNGFPVGSVLKMRPIGESTPDDQLKEKWLDEAMAQGNTIDFVVDDRPKVVRMWRRRGIFVFDVNQTGKEF